MRKSEIIISSALAAVVLFFILALQRNWAPPGLKAVASTAEHYVLSKARLGGGLPEVPGFHRIRTYYLDRQYRAALFRSDSITLGFAPGRLLISNQDSQVFSLNTLEGARDAWTAFYDFAGRHGLTVRGEQHPAYLRDLTGDGRLDAIVGVYSGGDRCCTTVNVLEVGQDALKSIGHIEGAGGWPFESLDIRKIGRSTNWELVVHRPRLTACGPRDDAADVIAIYAYSDGEFKDQTSRFSDYIQSTLQQNLAKWSREKEPSLGLLQTLAVQLAALDQKDRAKDFFKENLPRFLPQLQQRGIDPVTCRDDLDALVDHTVGLSTP